MLFTAFCLWHLYKKTPRVSGGVIMTRAWNLTPHYQVVVTSQSAKIQVP